MAFSSSKTLIAKSNKELHITPKMANRHGLITGATGTGKTVSLQVLAEAFSYLGVPVFMTDIKGDLSGISKAGQPNDKIKSRVEKLELNGYENKSFPTIFFDLFGENGHRMRTTISEMGPLLLGRLLDLNDTQTGILSIAFKYADENGYLLLDMKDLRSLLQYIGENRNMLTNEYGNVTSASVGSIQRKLLTIEEQGGNYFFGEPSFNIFDMLKTNSDGLGQINILNSVKLMNYPRVYSTFLLWLLSELFERLPEVGDLDKPKLVFFFDEAHLLFNEAPKALREKIEQVVRLIRSKGVGIFFISQNPLDIPEEILGQLGNRIQHALRAYTPRDQKAVNTAATTFRANPEINTAQAITELGVGEALVSFLDEKGVPNMVERAFILPPCSQIGPITNAEKDTIIKSSILYGVYDKDFDRVSAFEMLKQKVEEANAGKEEVSKKNLEKKEEIAKMKEEAAIARAKAAKERAEKSLKKQNKSIFEEIATQTGKTVQRQLTNKLGTTIVRGILGSIFGKR